MILRRAITAQALAILASAFIACGAVHGGSAGRSTATSDVPSDVRILESDDSTGSQVSAPRMHVGGAGTSESEAAGGPVRVP